MINITQNKCKIKKKNVYLTDITFHYFYKNIVFWKYTLLSVHNIVSKEKISNTTLPINEQVVKVNNRFLDDFEFGQNVLCFNDKTLQQKL